jgi:predicted AlkP superfamily pyrophosphatase or phosphodiesterase
MTDGSGDKPLSALGPSTHTFESDEIACETSQALLPESRRLKGPANRHLGVVDWAAILLCLLISVAVAYLSLFAGASADAGANQSVDDISSRFPPVAQTVLVSIDGFRHDYIDRTNEHGAFIAPTLRKILSQGVSAVRGMQPVMPSVTFPNHNSLVTGLFPESSRIVANTMYNPRTNQWWHMSDDDPSWWGGEPIWVTLQRTKRRGKASPILDDQADAKFGGGVTSSSSNYTTASVFWPGSTVEGRRPNIWSTYNNSISYDDRVARVLSLLSGTAPDWRGQRADFVAVYFEGVDHAGHEYGTTSPELAAEIARVDASIAELWRQVPGINLIVVSDHGSTLSWAF